MWEVYPKNLKNRFFGLSESSLESSTIRFRKLVCIKAIRTRFAIDDFSGFDALKYEFISWDWYKVNKERAAWKSSPQTKCFRNRNAQLQSGHADEDRLPRNYRQ